MNLSYNRSKINGNLSSKFLKILAKNTLSLEYPQTIMDKRFVDFLKVSKILQYSSKSNSQEVLLAFQSDSKRFKAIQSYSKSFKVNL